MKTITILLNFLILNIVYSQKGVNNNFEKIGEKLRDSKNHVIIHQTIETSNGRAIAVGETSSKTHGGSDGYIAIFNPTGADLKEKIEGDTRDDVFNGIAQLLDGTFLIAGSTKRAGKEKAWLIQIDETGEIIREGFFNSAGLISFQSVLASDDGGAFLIGSYEEDNKAEIKFMKIYNWQLEVDTNINIGGFVKKISSAVLAYDGNIVIVGDTKKTKNVQKEDIWLAKIDKNGEVVHSFLQQYGEAKYHETAAQIIRTSDKGFAIVGTTNNTDGDGYNAWVLKLDELGKRSWEGHYGGRDIDFAQSIVQTNDDYYYIVGKTLSQTTDARSYQVYFVKIEPSGRKKWEAYEGDKGDNDLGTYITALHDGYFLLTAATENNSWFYSFKAHDDNIYNTSIIDKSFRRTDWTVNSDSKYLEAGTKTSLSFSFANITENLIKNVQIKCTSPTKDIEPQIITYLGSFRSHQVKTVSIPIKTGVGLDDNTYLLEIEIIVGDKSIERFSQPVNTKKLPPSQIHIVTPPQYDRLSDDETVLKLKIKNPTNTVAQNLSLKIELPRGLKALSDTRLILNPIETGKTSEILFKYQGDINTENSKPQIRCSLFQKDTLKDEKQIDAIPLINSYTTNDKLRWHIPDEETAPIQSLATQKSHFDVELRAYTTEPISSPDKFKIYVNDKLIEGAKTEVVELSNTPTQNVQILKRTFEFLSPGTYTIRIELKTSRGTISSSTLVVKYNPEKSTLHIVSIGTSHSDLKYTRKDAVDFGTFFQKDTSTLFKETKVAIYADSNKTDYMNFYRIFTDLVKRYENNTIDNRIEENDYLIVFISSHGKTGENKQYKILPSGYNRSDNDKFTIDYQTDIIDNLNKVKCHKLVFIDACHSGAGSGAKGIDNAEALVKINAASVGTTILTSCRSEEESYEDENWQNGAFTKALLEAFSNQNCSDEKSEFISNQDNDSFITIEEIVNFVKRRVPKLVILQKGVSKSQNPVLNDVKLDLSIPLIEIKN